LVGGYVAAPIFTDAAVPGDFSALCFAAATAATALFVRNLVLNRRGV
jgi:hypothetical protein